LTPSASFRRARQRRRSDRAETIPGRTPRDRSLSSLLRQTNAPRPRDASFSETATARRRTALDSALDGRVGVAWRAIAGEAARGFPIGDARSRINQSSKRTRIESSKRTRVSLARREPAQMARVGCCAEPTRRLPAWAPKHGPSNVGSTEYWIVSRFFLFKVVLLFYSV
jgi:hypothetical protein